MRLKQIILLLLGSSCIIPVHSSKLPYLFNSNANQLYIVNPAFHGTNSGFRNELMEFGVQSMYSPQFQGPAWQVPIFYAGYSSGCFGYELSGIRKNSNINNFFFTSGKTITNKFRIGYGGSVGIENFDQWSNGLNYNVGISLQKMIKGKTLSFGINIKNDQYDAKVNVPEQNPMSLNVNTINADIGVAYTNRAKGLKAGFSIFNLKRNLFGYTVNNGWFSSQSLYMFYDRFGIINFNKNYKLNDKIELANSLTGIFSQDNVINCEQISLISSFNIKTSSKNILGIGMAIKPINYDFMGVLIGPNFTYSTGIMSLQYSYQRYTNYGSTYSGGMHEIGLKYSVRVSSRRTITPNF